MSYARKTKSFISTFTLSVLLLSQSLAGVALPVFESMSPVLQEIADVIETPVPVANAQSGGQWVRATASHITACNAIGEQRAVSPEGLGCVSGENVPGVRQADGSLRLMEPFTFSAFNERGCWPNNCSANLKDVATMNTEAPHGSIFCYDEGQKRDADRTDRNVYVYCTGGSDDGGNNDNQCGGFEGNNILSNGSFESPEVGQTNGNKYEIFDDIPNWSLPSNYIELQENGVDLGDGATGNAYAGDQWAELDEEGANQLQRTFNTTPGHAYRLQFHWSPRPKALANQRVDIWFNGNVVGFVEANGSNMHQPSWTNKVIYLYPGNDTSGTVTFRTREASGQGKGILIDDVKLTKSNNSCSGGSNPPPRPICNDVNTNFSGGQPTLSWSANEADISSYIINAWKYNTNTETWDLSHAESVPKGTNQVTIPKKGVGQFAFRVRSIGNDGTSSEWCLDSDEANKAEPWTTMQCQDGFDNDGDNQVDFGQDPECTGLRDNKESADDNGNNTPPGAVNCSLKTIEFRDGRPVIQWSGGERATSFSVWVRKDGQEVYRQDALATTTTQWQIPVGQGLSAGAHRFRVEAHNAFGTTGCVPVDETVMQCQDNADNDGDGDNNLADVGCYGDVRNNDESAEGPHVPPGALTCDLDALTFNNGQPTLSWTAAERATHYSMTVHQNGQEVYRQDDLSANTLQWRVPFVKGLEAGDYRFRAIAHNAYGSTGCAVIDETVMECQDSLDNDNDGTKNLADASCGDDLREDDESAGNGGGTGNDTPPGAVECNVNTNFDNGRPTITWSGGEGAQKFHLTVRQGGEVIYEQDDLATSTTSWQIPVANALEAGDYRFRIVASNAQGDTGCSPVDEEVMECQDSLDNDNDGDKNLADASCNDNLRNNDESADNGGGDTPPGAVECNLNTNFDNGRPTITWSGGEGAESFTFFVKQGGEDVYRKEDISTSVNSWEVPDADALAAGEYRFRVEAVNAEGTTGCAVIDETVMECQDGGADADNDNDGLINLEDPGCDNLRDDSESNAPPAFECREVVTSFIGGTPRLQWQNAVGETGYDVKIWRAGESSAFYTRSVPANTAFHDVEEQLDAGQYSFRVLAKSDAGNTWCGTAATPFGVNVCQDGADNDTDSFTDFPDDKGCSEPTDTSEIAECQDGIDNDGDGNIDNGEDNGCSSVNDDSEDTEGDRPAVPVCTGIDTNPTTTFTDGLAEVTWNDVTGESKYVVAFYQNSVLIHESADLPANTTSYVTGLPLAAGNYTYTVRAVNSAGSSNPCEGAATNFRVMACQDSIDNDGDNFNNHPADAGCNDLRDDNELSQCQDGSDNDNDGLTDLADPGCTGVNDNTEDPETSACQDGEDNDGDGLVDENDPGCENPLDDDEEDEGTAPAEPVCNAVSSNFNDGKPLLTWSNVDGANSYTITVLSTSNEVLLEPTSVNGTTYVSPAGWEANDLMFRVKAVNEFGESDYCTKAFSIYACQDSFDNDQDGWNNYRADVNDATRDLGCGSLTDNDETSQCQDGQDNDGDQLTDLDDPGCAGANDNTENSATSQCQDGQDNDNDGVIDRHDPGCLDANGNYDPTIDDESLATTQCQDGVENDTPDDGRIDANDPGCLDANGNYDPTDNSEANTYACSDSPIDNDGDGLVDHPQDPGCSGPFDDTETNADGPACDNGIDDDNDGLVDSSDPGCYDEDGNFDPADDDETDPSGPGEFNCNDIDTSFTDGKPTFSWTPAANVDGYLFNVDGFSQELAADVTTFTVTQRLAAGNDIAVITAFNQYGFSSCDVQFTVTVCQDGVDSDGDGFVDQDDAACTSPTDTTELTECQDGQDNDNDGAVDANDPGCKDENGNYNPQDTSETGDPALPECSDGVDNADPEDTLADYNDPGCYTDGVYNPNDNDETNEAATTQCNDGQDNDNDGLVDAADPGCQNADGSHNPNDDNETDDVVAPECSDGVDNADPEDTLADHNDPGCYTDGKYNPNDDDETDPAPAVPKAPVCTAFDGNIVFTDGKVPLSWAPALRATSYNVTVSSAVQDVVVWTGTTENTSIVVDPGLSAGTYTFIVTASNAAGTSTACTAQQLLVEQCRDAADNDKDGANNHPADGGCTTPRDNDEVSQCQDGIDNDGDGRIDYSATPANDNRARPIVIAPQSDPGCSSIHDDSETNPDGPQCDNGFDDDADGKIDYNADGSGDPDCTGPTDPTEDTPVTQCNDGQDNDGDGLIDAADPGCLDANGNYNPLDTNEGDGLTECNDDKDNETPGDGVVDALDPGCWTDPTDPTTYDPFNPTEGDATTQCQDMMDNDGDGLADAADPGCSTPQDNDETDTTPTQCNDGIDNDNDGGIDFKTDGTGDPGCASLADDDESDIQPVCNDGADNDSDGLIDFKTDGSGDPGCDSLLDGDESNSTPATTLVITDSPDPVSRGSQLTYTLTVTNPSTTALTATLVMNLDNNVAYTSSTANGTHANNVVQWPVNALSAGGTATFSTTVRVKSDAPSSLNSTANINGATDSETTTVLVSNGNTDVDIEIELDTDLEDIEKCEEVVYILTVTNNTDVDLNDYEFIFEFDEDQLEFEQADPDEEDDRRGKLEFEEDIDANDDIEVEIEFTLNCDGDVEVGDDVEVEASSDDDDDDYEFIYGESCNTDDISVEIDQSPRNLRIGDELVIEIEVNNDSNDDTDYEIVVQLADAMILVDTDPRDDKFRNQEVTLDELDVDEGDKEVFEIVVQVADTYQDGDDFTIVAEVTDNDDDDNYCIARSDDGELDIDDNNTGGSSSSSSSSTAANNDFRINVTKQSNTTETAPGNQINYTITINNLSGESGVVNIEDTFTAGNLSVNGDSSAVPTSSGLRWDNVTIQPNETRFFRYSATVNPSMRHGERIVNNVMVTGDSLASAVSASNTVQVIEQLPQTGAFSDFAKGLLTRTRRGSNGTATTGVNPLGIAGVAALLFVLGGGGFLLWRRRNAHGDFGPDFSVIQNEPTVEPTLEELAKMPEADVDTLLAEDPEQASVFQSSLTDEMPDETPEAPSTPEDTV